METRSMLFLPTHYIDFHTHRLRRQDRSDIAEIVSIHMEQEERAHEFYTIGKHPWWTEKTLSEEEISLFQQHLSSEKCLAMGEMGLDKLKGPKMEIQINVLRSQLDVAQEMNVSVIIHCVKAYDQLLQIKKEYPEIKKWCIHGYSRHATLAKQLIAQGFHLSIMPMKPSDKYTNLLQSLPREKFFLETDSMPNILIENLYLQAAKVLGISVEALKAQMAENANNFFNNKKN